MHRNELGDLSGNATPLPDYSAIRLSQVGRAQDVPDVHRAELGTCRATLAFALLLPDLRSTFSQVGYALRTFSGLAR